MITHTEQPMTSESDIVTPPQQLSATDKQIINSVPQTMQNRAKLLIQKLKDHSDIISWNDNGQLVLEGTQFQHCRFSKWRGKALIQNIQAHLPSTRKN